MAQNPDSRPMQSIKYSLAYQDNTNTRPTLTPSLVVKVVTKLPPTASFTAEAANHYLNNIDCSLGNTDSLNKMLAELPILRS